MAQRRSARARRTFAASLLCPLLVVGTSAQAHATTISVTTLRDGGTGSLRAAIIAANRTPAADTIRFASRVHGILGLRRALPDLKSDITIVGPGRERLNVRRVGSARYRIFTVTAKAKVSLSGLTLSNGNINLGAGLFNEGRVKIDDCTITGNNASEGGGGLYNNGSQMQLNRCLVTNNTCVISEKHGYVDGGGGLLNDNGTASLTDCTFSGNIADKLSGVGASDNSGGGAIACGHGEVEISRSVLVGNEARRTGDDGGGSGGALCATGEAGAFTVKDSAIINNTALSGGAASGQYGFFRLTNCTLSGNRATRFGGAMNNGQGSTQIFSCTIVNNIAPEWPGIAIGSYGKIANSIIAGNLTPSHAPGKDVYIWLPESMSTRRTPRKVVISQGHNLIGQGDPKSMAFFGPSDRRNVSFSGLKLGPLASNGGLTPTHALRDGSPAINAGSTTLPTDQRGEARADGDSDIGAFEAKAKAQ